MSKHLGEYLPCDCDEDVACARHRDEEARMEQDMAAIFRGAILAGVILPAGVQREVRRELA